MEVQNCRPVRMSLIEETTQEVLLQDDFESRPADVQRFFSFFIYTVYIYCFACQAS